MSSFYETGLCKYLGNVSRVKNKPGNLLVRRMREQRKCRRDAEGFGVSYGSGACAAGWFRGGCLIVLRRRKLFNDDAVAEDVVGCPTVLEAEDCQAGREEKCHGEVFDEGPQQSPAKSNIPGWIHPDTALANLFHAGT